MMNRKQKAKAGARQTANQQRSFRRSRSLDLIAQEKLKLLEELVPKLARAIAPVCEIALHENTSRPPTIRAIGNGHVTGRQVGDLMTQILIDGEDVRDRKTPLFNYMSKTPEGRKIRVSLLPVVHDGEVIAYVAVNFSIQDLDAARQTLSLLAMPEPHKKAIKENFLWPHDIIEKTVDEYVHTTAKPIALMGRTDRIELVQLLKQRGAFGMKGAVDEIASALGVSRTAVYNYLNCTEAESG